MAGKSDRPRLRWVRWAAGLGALAVGCWFFPLFHVKPLAPAATAVPATGGAGFDAKAAAQEFWRERLIPAAAKAAELAPVVQALRADPEAARKRFGKPAGVGVDYFFIRGRGRILARERNVLRIAVEGAPNEVVSLRIGPVFGNTVRDGTGLLDVNAFPGLQEFNALSAELNTLVESRVLLRLRETAKPEMTVEFAGCVEAPESAADVGEPLFTVVPVQAEVR